MNNRGIVSLALLLIALVPNCLLAQPFFYRKDIPVGERLYAFAVGDFNGDGRPDLAVGAFGDGFFVLLNEGGGSFGRPIPNETYWRDPPVGDFDGDGRDDLATGEGLLLSRGDGTFLAPRPIGNFDPQNTSPLATGDFNRDGKSDLLLGDPEGVRVWLGNGDGTFQPGATVATLSAGVRQVVVADFDRDGRSDVAMLPKSNRHTLLVVLGQGNGTFGPEISTPIDTLALLAADFNGDGFPDVATSVCVLIPGTCKEGMTGIALGNGNGSFQPPLPYPSWEEGTFPVAAADFTGDGTADLVAVRSNIGGVSCYPLPGGVLYYLPLTGSSSSSTNSISIYPGRGDGTFLPRTEHSTGPGPHGAAAADLDGDDQLDLVTANYWGPNTISVLLARAEGDAALQRAVSAASYTAIVAPESLATLFAAAPATTSTSASPPWPMSLGGISLEIRDSTEVTRLAPLLYVSPTQINFQVPAGTALGEATLAVVSAGGRAEVGSMQVDTVAPGLFMVSHVNLTPAATGVLVETDDTQVPVPVFSCSPSAGGISCDASPIPLTSAGDGSIYLSFYGTGFRGANPDDVTCSMLGVQVPILYAGPQETPGLDQINVHLSPKLVEAVRTRVMHWGFGGPVPVTITINGIAANSAEIVLR